MKVQTRDPNGFFTRKGFNSMDATKSVMINLSAYEYNGTEQKDKHGFGGFPHPRDIAAPAGVIKRAWIPQTMGDSIWILYEFENTEARDDFVSNPDSVFQAASIRIEDQTFYDHWCS